MSDARELRQAIYRAIDSNVRSERDRHFIDRRWLVGVNDAVDAILDIIGNAQAAPLPDRERMAEILYTAAHKGLRNCWKWSDAELDHEHPTSRGYWYKIADGTLSALSSTDREGK